MNRRLCQKQGRASSLEACLHGQMPLTSFMVILG